MHMHIYKYIDRDLDRWMDMDFIPEGLLMALCDYWGHRGSDVIDSPALMKHLIEQRSL